MKFPVDVKIYLKSGEYIGDGKIIDGHNIGYTYNILHNIDGYLYGHLENKEKTGFKYGCGVGRWLNDDINDFSVKDWLKYINERCMRRYTINIKNNCFFEDIEL